MLNPQYIYLHPESSIENVEVKAPFAAVVVINAKVSMEWRNIVSQWLVEKGCLYMMAYGDDCSFWDDSVDTANLTAHNWKDIPNDKFVTTTWHDDESIEEVFYFAQNCALPFSPLIKNIIVLDITQNPREQIMLSLYEEAHAEAVKDKTDYIKLYSSLGKKIENKVMKAGFGTLDERLSIVGPLFFFGVLCLFIGAIIEALWPRVVSLF